MHFFVYSRQAIEALPPHTVSHIIVSIRLPNDPKEVVLRTNKHTLEVLHMLFHDIDNYPPEIEKQLFEEHPELLSQLFTEEMGHQIIDFVLRHKNKAEHFIVHCDAGMSRSPGVAAVVCKAIYNEDDTSFFKRYTPNMRVYRHIMNAFTSRCSGCDRGLTTRPNDICPNMIHWRTWTEVLEAAIRKDRDASGHDLCWYRPELWELLPDGANTTKYIPPREEFLHKCSEYHTSLVELKK